MLVYPSINQKNSYGAGLSIYLSSSIPFHSTKFTHWCELATDFGPSSYNMGPSVKEVRNLTLAPH